MIEFKTRKAYKVFIFDMSSYPNPNFVTKNLEIVQKFSNDCVIDNLGEAVKIQDKIQSMFPTSNFQLELVPFIPIETPLDKAEFWKIWQNWNLPKKQNTKGI